jgi:hypothetical protein
MTFDDDDEGKGKAKGWRRLRKIIINTEKPVMEYIKTSISFY